MKDGVHRAVGERLRSLRVAHGLTLQELSTRLSDAGVEVSEATLNRVENGHAMLRLDTARGVFGLLGTSLGYIDEVIAEAQSRTDVDLTGKSFEALIDEGQKVLHYGDFHQALEYFRTARERWVLEESSDANDLAKALILEADCQRRLRRFQLSLDAAGTILNLAGASEEARLRAVLLHIAVYNMLGDFFRGKLYASYAQPLLSGCGPKLRAHGCATIGNLYFKQDQFEEAIRHLECAKNVCEQHGFSLQANQIRITLGYCFFRTGHVRSALRLVRQSLENASRVQQLVVVGYALRTLGRIAFERGSLDEAREDFSKAASISRKLHLDTDLFIAVYNLWRIDLESGNDRMARRQLASLRHLIRTVDASLPEASEFLARMATAGKGRNRR